LVGYYDLGYITVIGKTVSEADYTLLDNIASGTVERSGEVGSYVYTIVSATRIPTSVYNELSSGAKSSGAAVAVNAPEPKLYTNTDEFFADYPNRLSYYYAGYQIGSAIAAPAINLEEITATELSINSTDSNIVQIAKDKGVISYFEAVSLLELGYGLYFVTTDPTNSHAMSTLDTYRNKYSFESEFASCGGFADVASIKSALSSFVLSRKDTTLVLSTDFVGTKNDSTIQDALDAANAFAITMSNASYGAMFGPWIKGSIGVSPYTLTTYLPADYVYLRCFAVSLAQGNVAWMPIAGVRRGLVSFANGVEYKLSETEMDDTWQNIEEVQANINPIVDLNTTYGYVLFGQRTLQKDPNTSLKSLNVRIISNMIKRRIFNICLGLTFEMNDLILWNEFKGQLDPYLANMKYNRGLHDYKIVMDSDSQQNASNELTVKGYVRIYPVRSAEYFDIDFTLTNNSAEFEEV
jgi:hypothetical protein